MWQKWRWMNREMKAKQQSYIYWYCSIRTMFSMIRNKWMKHVLSSTVNSSQNPKFSQCNHSENHSGAAAAVAVVAADDDFDQNWVKQSWMTFLVWEQWVCWQMWVHRVSNHTGEWTRVPYSTVSLCQSTVPMVQSIDCWYYSGYYSGCYYKLNDDVVVVVISAVVAVALSVSGSWTGRDPWHRNPPWQSPNSVHTFWAHSTVRYDDSDPCVPSVDDYCYYC